MPRCRFVHIPLEIFYPPVSTKRCLYISTKLPAFTLNVRQKSPLLLCVTSLCPSRPVDSVRTKEKIADDCSGVKAPVLVAPGLRASHASNSKREFSWRSVHPAGRSRGGAAETEGVCPSGGEELTEAHTDIFCVCVSAGNHQQHPQRCLHRDWNRLSASVSLSRSITGRLPFSIVERRAERDKEALRRNKTQIEAKCSAL